MRQTSRSSIEFSTAELRLLLRTLRLLQKVGEAVGFGPADGDDAEQAALAIEAMLQRRNVAALPLKQPRVRPQASG